MQPAGQFASTRTKEDAAADAEARKIVDTVVGSGSPVFEAIGVTGENITTPQGLVRAVGGIISGTDADGKPLTGLGLQLAPAQIIPRWNIGNREYRTNRLARAFARLQVNAAYAKADAGDAGKPERAAFGASWIAFDSTDPFANDALEACLDKVENQASENPGKPSEVSDEESGFIANENARCRAEHLRTPTNGHTGRIGFAKILRNRDGRDGSLVGHGFAANATVSFGLDCFIKAEKDCRKPLDPDDPTAQIGFKLVLGAVWRNRELVINPLDDTKFVDRNRLTIGGRFLMGDPRKFWVGVEMLTQRADYEGAIGRDRYTSYGATGEFRIGEGKWFTISYGDTWGTNFSKGAQFSVGLKYGLSGAPTLGN